MSEDLALSVRHVTSGYREGGLLGKKTYQEVLHDVTFDVRHGEILGLVGESGTGKSTLARTILGMVKPDAGEVIHYTKRPQMIFQDPYSSLNPAYTVAWNLEEPLRIYGKYDADERRRGALRRPASAGVHRGGTDPAASVFDRGRTGQRPGRYHSGPDPEAAERPAARAGSEFPLRLP